MHLVLYRIASHRYHIMVGGANHPVNDVGLINRLTQKILHNWNIVCDTINVNVRKRCAAVALYRLQGVYFLSTSHCPPPHTTLPPPLLKNSWMV